MGDECKFSKIIPKQNNRIQAALSFYHLCVLATNNFVTVKQEKPYGDISIKKGVNF